MKTKSQFIAEVFEQRAASLYEPRIKKLIAQHEQALLDMGHPYHDGCKFRIEREVYAYDARTDNGSPLQADPT